MAYGFAIAGHVIIALFLILGAFERTEAASDVAIPVGIVMEKPEQASPSPDPASNDRNRWSDIPAVADADKHVKAPLAALDVNGVDRPKQPGRDGGDPSRGLPGTQLPQADGDLASGAASLPSWAMHVAPIGPAPPQTTAREPGEDDLTAIKEQKLECGRKARRPSPTVAIRGQVRVTGDATQAQVLAMIRWSQVVLDRRINPRYFKNQHVFVETMDGVGRTTVALPAGLTVNVGDVIEVDQGHIDPSDPCQYIPNIAVGRPG